MVFPPPLGPTIATVCPPQMERLKSCMTCLSMRWDEIMLLHHCYRARSHETVPCSESRMNSMHGLNTLVFLQPYSCMALYNTFSSGRVG